MKVTWKKGMLSILFVLLVCTGCGKENSESGETSGVTHNMVYDPPQDTYSQDMPLSPEREDITYEGAFPRKHSWAAGGNRIYQVGYDGEEKHLYYMKAGDTTFQEISDIDFSEWIVRAMDLDKEGNCHMLLLSAEEGRIFTHEKTEICVVGENGQILDHIVTSDEVTQFSPECFAVGTNGRYYLGSQSTGLYELNAEGGLERQVDIFNLKGVGVGDNGEVYASAIRTDTSGNAVCVLYRVNEQGDIQETGITLPVLAGGYDKICPGRESDIWIYGKSEGLWGYQPLDGVLTQLMSVGDFPCNVQNMVGCAPMQDGRMLFIYEEEGEMVFSYVPFL